MALNWTGVISEGILKLRLAFDASVSIPERMRQLADYARSFTDSGDFKILKTEHYSDGSSMEAKISSD